MFAWAQGALEATASMLQPSPRGPASAAGVGFGAGFGASAGGGPRLGGASSSSLTSTRAGDREWEPTRSAKRPAIGGSGSAFPETSINNDVTSKRLFPTPAADRRSVGKENNAQDGGGNAAAAAAAAAGGAADYGERPAAASPIGFGSLLKQQVDPSPPASQKRRKRPSSLRTSSRTAEDAPFGGGSVRARAGWRRPCCRSDSNSIITTLPGAGFAGGKVVWGRAVGPEGAVRPPAHLPPLLFLSQHVEPPGSHCSARGRR